MKYNIKYKVNGDNPPFNVKLYENEVSGTPVAQMNVIEVNKFQYFNDIDFTKKYCLVATDNLGYSFDLCYEIDTYEIQFASVNGNVRLKYYNENRLLNNYESVRFLEGVNIEINAEASSGYKFLNWTEPQGGTPIVSGSTSQVETFIMPNRNLDISPKFIKNYSSGEIDGEFNIGIGFNDEVMTIIKDSNGKYVIGGRFTKYNGEVANHIIRLNPNGSIDTSFNVGSGFGDNVITIIEDSNGKYVIGGGFKKYNGEVSNHIIRLNQNGSVDTSFNVGSGFKTDFNHHTNQQVMTIIEDSNGKYVIGGEFTRYKGEVSNRIIRLNQNGSVDNTFIIGGGFFNDRDGGDQGIKTIIEDSNGKYVIGGIFRKYKDITCSHNIIRLNQNGSVDTSFNVGTGFHLYDPYGEWSDGTVNTIIEDSNGKYVVGGYYRKFNNNVNNNSIIRIEPNGDKDDTFYIHGSGGLYSTQGASLGRIYSLIQDSDGKYIIGGNFINYGGNQSTSQVWGGISLNRIGRLNLDGSLDDNFVIDSGFNNSVRSIIQDVDKYVVGGRFTSYKNIDKNNIIRLYK